MTLQELYNITWLEFALIQSKADKPRVTGLQNAKFSISELYVVTIWPASCEKGPSDICKKCRPS